MGNKLKKFKPRNALVVSMNLSRKGGPMTDNRHYKRSRSSFEDEWYDDDEGGWEAAHLKTCETYD
jgi:hypothetical protein